MEKMSASNVPVLAIPAGLTPAIARFVHDAALLAGWQTGADGAAVLSISGDEIAVFQGKEKAGSISLPFRAAQLISLLQKIKGDAFKLPAVIPMGPYLLKPYDYLLETEGAEFIRLTEKETAILVCLSSGKTLSRQELLNAVWAYVDGVETHTLETHIYRLRQKIEKDPSQPAFLLTEEDGYRLKD